jgi:alpha-mannosidase
VAEPDSGRVTSLVERGTGREVLAPRAGMDLFSFVRERPDPLVDGSRRAFYRRELEREMLDESCWVPWSPIREPAEQVTGCRVLERPGCVVLERAFTAPGTKSLVQRIRLDALDPVIRVEVEFDWTRSSCRGPHAAG